VPLKIWIFYLHCIWTVVSFAVLTRPLFSKGKLLEKGYIYVNLAEKLLIRRIRNTAIPERTSNKTYRPIYRHTVEWVVTERERENKILRNLKIMAGKDNL
jgi:hypothetical protein